jgi:hypothetical protein
VAPQTGPKGAPALATVNVVRMVGRPTKLAVDEFCGHPTLIAVSVVNPVEREGSKLFDGSRSPMLPTAPPLPPSDPPMGAPADGTPYRELSEVRFLYSTDLVLPGQFKLWGPDGRFLGCFRRDGVGLRAVQMNFALDDAWSRTIFLVRRQKPPHIIGYGTPWAVLDGAGVRVGELTWSGRQAATLTLPDRASYTAQLKLRSWKSFDVVTGGRCVATASLPQPFFPTPGNPGGLRLQFAAPGATPEDRSFAVLLTAFACVFRSPPGWPRV